MSQHKPVHSYYDAVAAEYQKIYEPESMSYKNGIGDYFRLQIVLRLLAQNNAKSVFEVGVGNGTPLAHMAAMGLDVAGCDISQAMVDESMERLKGVGVTEPQIWKADISNALEISQALFRQPADALVALGVMPHVEKDLLALRNMRTLVKAGGKLIIEFRNSLFSLFTFNRYTHEFIVNELLSGASNELREKVSNRIKDFVAMDLPPVRDVAPDQSSPGYDVILSKFHNPFEIPALLEQAGFANARFHWYHFHAAPPMMQNELAELFDRDSIAMEHVLINDWRGYFLCSAVTVEADAV